MSGTFGAKFFDASFYLRQNLDVTAAVLRGDIKSALDHFQQYGRFENRFASENFDAAQYLLNNQDVLNAIASKQIASAWDHFVTYGVLEDRANGEFSGKFNDAGYLAANKDVADAVKAGAFANGYQHYLLYGQSEGRAAFNFNEAGYLAANPDVADAVKAGTITSGYQHYALYGVKEGRDAPGQQINPIGVIGGFDEAAYLALHKDVAAAVTAGAFANGFDHYKSYGQAEGRLAYNLNGEQINLNAKIYALTASADAVNEGNTVLFTLQTTNVAPGARFDYAISGVSASDVVGGLSGTAVIGADGKAVIAIQIAADRLTEVTAETLTLTVAGQTKGVSINDTSISPTYTLTSSADAVNEGDTVVFTLQTTNVDAGARFDYVISGVSAADVVGGLLTGSAVVDANGKAEIRVPVALDGSSELTETLTLTVAGQAQSVSINNVAQTILLTQGLDDIQAGEGNDLIRGTNIPQTFNAGDEINGGGGRDTLVLQLTSEFTFDGEYSFLDLITLPIPRLSEVASGFVTNVEAVTVYTESGNLTFPAPIRLRMNNFDDSVEQINILNAEVDVLIWDQQSLADATIRDTARNILLDYDAQVVAGAEDVLRLTLDEVGRSDELDSDYWYGFFPFPLNVSPEGPYSTLSIDAGVEHLDLHVADGVGEASNVLIEAPGVGVVDVTGGIEGQDVTIALNTNGGTSFDSTLFEGDVRLFSGDVKTALMGDGNDELQIFGWADNTDALYSLGAGNNALTITDVTLAGEVTAADGNNEIDLVSIAASGSVTLGDGDNHVDVNDDVYGGITLGDGNNELHIEDHVGASESIPGEDDAIAATLVFGNGDNEVTVGGDIEGSSTLTFGNGDNELDVSDDIADGSTVSFGDGNNSVYVYDGEDGSESDIKENATLIFGDGDNTVVVERHIEGSTVTLGGGANTLSVGDSIREGSTLTFGGGDNAVTVTDHVDDSTLTFGDGDNTVAVGDDIQDGSTLTFGNGSNTVTVGSDIEEASTVIFGDGGNDLTVADDIQEGSTVTFGLGADSLTLGSLGEDDRPDNGDLTISGLDGEQTTVDMGEGDDTVMLRTAGGYIPGAVGPAVPDMPVIVQSGAVVDGSEGDDVMTLQAAGSVALIQRTEDQVVELDLALEDVNAYTVGQVVTVTFTRGEEELSVSYTVKASDIVQGDGAATSANVAAGLTEELNEADNDIDGVFSATASGAVITLTSEDPHLDFAVTSTAGTVSVVDISDARIKSFETLNLVALDNQDGPVSMTIEADFDLIDGTSTINLDSQVQRVEAVSNEGQEGEYSSYEASGPTTFVLDNLKGGEEITVSGHEATATGQAQVESISVGDTNADHRIGDKIAIRIGEWEGVYTVVAADLVGGEDSVADAGRIAAKLQTMINAASAEHGLTAKVDVDVDAEGAADGLNTVVYVTLIGNPGAEPVDVDVAHTRTATDIILTNDSDPTEWNIRSDVGSFQAGDVITVTIGDDEYTYTVTEEDMAPVCGRTSAERISEALAAEIGGDATADWGVVRFGDTASFEVERTIDALIGKTYVENLQDPTATDDHAIDVTVAAQLAAASDTDNDTMTLTVDGQGDFDLAIQPVGEDEGNYEHLELTIADSHSHYIDTYGEQGNFAESITLTGGAAGEAIYLDWVAAKEVSAVSPANITINQYGDHFDQDPYPENDPVYDLLSEEDVITVETGSGDDHLLTLAQAALNEGSSIDLGAGRNTLSLGWGAGVTLQTLPTNDIASVSELMAGNSGKQDYAVTVGTAIQSNLFDGDDKDTFEVFLEAGKTYQVSAFTGSFYEAGSAYDITLSLFDLNLTQIAGGSVAGYPVYEGYTLPSSEDGWYDQDSIDQIADNGEVRLFRPTVSGIYHFEVGAWEEDPGLYTFEVIERSTLTGALSRQVTEGDELLWMYAIGENLYGRNLPVISINEQPSSLPVPAVIPGGLELSPLESIGDMNFSGSLDRLEILNDVELFEAATLVMPGGVGNVQSVLFTNVTTYDAGSEFPYQPDFTIQGAASNFTIEVEGDFDLVGSSGSIGVLTVVDAAGDEITGDLTVEAGEDARFSIGNTTLDAVSVAAGEEVKVFITANEDAAFEIGSIALRAEADQAQLFVSNNSDTAVTIGSLSISGDDDADLEVLDNDGLTLLLGDVTIEGVDDADIFIEDNTDSDITLGDVSITLLDDDEEEEASVEVGDNAGVTVAIGSIQIVSDYESAVRVDDNILSSVTVTGDISLSSDSEYARVVIEDNDETDVSLAASGTVTVISCDDDAQLWIDNNSNQLLTNDGDDQDDHDHSILLGDVVLDAFRDAEAHIQGNLDDDSDGDLRIELGDLTMRAYNDAEIVVGEDTFAVSSAEVDEDANISTTIVVDAVDARAQYDIRVAIAENQGNYWEGYSVRGGWRAEEDFARITFGDVSLNAGENVTAEIGSNDLAVVSLGTDEAESVHIAAGEDATVAITDNTDSSISLGDTVIEAGEDAGLAISGNSADPDEDEGQTLAEPEFGRTIVSLGDLEMTAGEDANLTIGGYGGNGNIEIDVSIDSVTMDAVGSAQFGVIDNETISVVIADETSITGEDVSFLVDDNLSTDLSVQDVALTASNDADFVLSDNRFGDYSLGNVTISAGGDVANNGFDIRNNDGGRLLQGEFIRLGEALVADYDDIIIGDNGSVTVFYSEYLAFTKVLQFSLWSGGFDTSNPIDALDPNLILLPYTLQSGPSAGREVYFLLGENGEVSYDDTLLGIFASELGVNAPELQALLGGLTFVQDYLTIDIESVSINAAEEIDASVRDNNDASITIAGDVTLVSGTIPEAGAQSIDNAWAVPDIEGGADVTLDIRNNDDSRVWVGYSESLRSTVTLQSGDTARLNIDDNDADGYDAEVQVGDVVMEAVNDVYFYIGDNDGNGEDDVDVVVGVGTLTINAGDYVDVEIDTEDDSHVTVGDIAIDAGNDVDFDVEGWGEDADLTLGNIDIHAGLTQTGLTGEDGGDFNPAFVDFDMQDVDGTEEISIDASASLDSLMEVYIYQAPDLHTLTLSGSHADLYLQGQMGGEGPSENRFTLDLSGLTGQFGLGEDYAGEHGDRFDYGGDYASTGVFVETWNANFSGTSDTTGIVTVKIGSSDLVYNAAHSWSTNASGNYWGEPWTSNEDGWYSLGYGGDFTPDRMEQYIETATDGEWLDNDDNYIRFDYENVTYTFTVGDDAGEVWFNQGQEIGSTGLYVYLENNDFVVVGRADGEAFNSVDEWSGVMDSDDDNDDDGDVYFEDGTSYITQGDQAEDNYGQFAREVFQFTGDTVNEVVIGGFNPGAWGEASPENGRPVDRLDWSQFDWNGDAEGNGRVDVSHFSFTIDDTDGYFKDVIIDFIGGDLVDAGDVSFDSVRLVGAGEFDDAINLVKDSMFFG